MKRPHPRLYKHILAIGCYGTAACFVSQGNLLADVSPDNSQIDLSDSHYTAPDFSHLAPVELQVFENGKWKAYDTRATEHGLEILVDTSGASLIYAWEGMEELQFQRKLEASTSQIVYSDNLDERIKQLKNDAELLLPFAGIPEKSAGGIHAVILSYLTALNERGEADRAYKVTQGTDLGRLPEPIALEAYNTVELLFSDDQAAEGEKLLIQLFNARPAEEFATNALDLAQRLAAERHFKVALGIYEPLLQIVPVDQRKAVALRTAYLALETGDFGKYKQLRTVASQAEGQSDETNAASWILDGIYAFKQDTEDRRQVLSPIGRALALLPSDSEWKEIALYYNYKAYQLEEAFETAKGILEELKLVYSKSAYTKDLTS
ncbi:hypothetical protein [Coraliomargarita parva]|uniref:hypothetical protein n=1 Tax=Coraliomargarita parva TaxID=3014050 RepID=UPI0022B5C80B|nr:hypothetical protein [Coraliomargarita parva]